MAIARTILLPGVFGSHAAEDTVEEAYVKALQTESYDPGRDAIRSWFTTLVRNACLDEIKHRRRRPVELADSALDLFPSVWAAPDPGERVDDNLFVLQCLAELAEPQRALLLLWAVGTSYADIAARQGIAVNSVGSMIQRALSVLRAEASPKDTPPT